jgi:hypothetical protein
MNYRHAFHAGGFADVIKHIVLARILTYLQEKPAAFRVIDTHAGGGLYDLTGDEARRSGEWLTGIARIMQARFSETAAPLLQPYLDIVRAFNARGDLKTYPGSPLVARALLRPQDRLTACEVEAKAREQLIDALRRDTQARVVDIDGWMALPAFGVASSWSIRRSKPRTNSNASPRALPRPSQNGPPAFTCCGIRPRAGARPMSSPATSPASQPRSSRPGSVSGSNSAWHRSSRTRRSPRPDF